MKNNEQNASIDSAILSLLLESRYQMLVVISADRKIIKVNKAFQDFIYKQTKKHITEGKDFLSYLSDNKASFYHELINKAINTGKQISFETQFDSSSENEYFQVILDPVKSADGNINHILIFSFDISDLRNAKNRLYEEKERLSVTLKSIGDGVIVTDLEEKIIYYNNAASDITGYDDTEVISKNLTEIFKIKSNQKNEITENIPIIKQILKKDNSLIHIEYTQNFIKNNSSKITGKIFVFKDVSSRIKMEEEIIKNSKLDSLSLLAGGLAHDYNNLLTAILGNITLCKIFTEDSNLLENLNQAEKAALKASDLTQKLITFSKGGDPVKSIFNLKDFIIESINFYVIGSNVKVIYNIDDNINQFKGDKNQLGQAINNIVINSKQSMPDGGSLIVNVKKADKNIDDIISKENGNYIKIEIIDEGDGINENIIHRIFDPYFTTKPNSLGLGLSAAYSIIKRHNGIILAENNSIKGTTMHLYLPDYTQEVSTPLVINTNKEKQNCLDILIMDDEKIIRDTLSSMLKQLGCKVTATENGNETIKIYKEKIKKGNSFDLVMLDLTIPGGMGGKQTMANLLDIDINVKAIVTSGYYDDPVISSWEKYGFSEVLKKPYTFDELTRLINKFRK